MIEAILICLGILWLAAASLCDLQKREVPNWIGFSLIIFALGFRFFYSVFESGNFDFFYQGLIGLGIFFVIGNLLYYARMFAGGDAKLMIAMGTILPFSSYFFSNLNFYFWFIMIFLFAGGIYGLIWSLVLCVRNFNNFKKEFRKRVNKEKKIIYAVMVLGLILMLFGFYETILFLLGIFIFVLPYFYLYAKSVDEVCMVRKVKPSELTEGDWLYKDVKVGGKLIKASWNGLDEKEINLLRKNKKDVLIRQGIPFVPVFLISYLVLIFWKIF